MTPNELHQLRILYDMAKANRRDQATGKIFSDRDFSRKYLKCNFSMVTKVLTGKAVSMPVVVAILKFVRDELPGIKATIESIDEMSNGG